MALPITEGILRLRDQATAVLKRFRKQMAITGKTTEARASRMIRAFTAFRGSLTGSLGAILSLKGAIIGAGFGFFAKSVLDAANTIEQATARLVGIKGGIDAAAESMAFFQEVAAGVPFTLEEVVEAGVSLEAFGARSEDTLRAVADLAGFMGVTIPEAARAFGRAFAGGAGAADVLRERGVLALVKMKAGVDDLKDLSLPGFRKALLAAMVAPLGPIAGAAKRLASTWQGQISIMSDAMFRLKTAIAEAGVLDFSKDIVRELTASILGLEEAFFAVDAEIGKTSKTASEFTGIAELLLIIVISLEFAVEFLAVGIIAVASAITLLVLAIPIAISAILGFDEALNRMQNTMQGFKDVMEDVLERMDDAPERFGRGQAAINAFREAQKKLSDATEDTNNQLQRQIDLTAGLAEKTKVFVGLTEIEIGTLGGLVRRIEEVRKGRLRSAEAEAAISRQRIQDLTGLIGALEFGAEGADELGKRLALALKEVPEEEFTKRVQVMIQVWQIFAEEVKKANDKIEASNKKTADAMRVMADRVSGLLKESGEGTQAFLTSLAASFNVNSASQFGSIIQNIGDFRRQLEANNASAEQQEAATWATRGAFVAAGLSTIRSLLETFGGESLAIQKAFAVADIIVNTSVAIMRALAELGPIAGPVAAALMAAMGAAQIAAVLAARPGSARGAVSVGGGGGGGPAGAPAAPPPAVMDRPPSVVNISLQGFVGDEATLAAELHRLLREAEGDGVQVTVL